MTVGPGPDQQLFIGILNSGVKDLPILNFPLIHIWNFLFLISCASSENPQFIERDIFDYYSDYFVFISDDSLDPLVVPVDLNWSPSYGGYDLEFKAWYGTDSDWPINYLLKTESLSEKKFPQEVFEHKDQAGFEFDSVKNLINLDIPNSPHIEFIFPEESSWVLAPSPDTSRKMTFATKAFIRVNELERKGWMIYERIRSKRRLDQEARNFSSFYWIPLVVNGNLFHFEKHGDEKSTFYWDNNFSQFSEIFQFEILSEEFDSISGRDNIANSIRIKSSSWDIDIILLSSGAQVGYGPAFPNGLAYYRQSLLTSTDSSADKGIGMMELILEDD